MGIIQPEPTGKRGGKLMKTHHENKKDDEIDTKTERRARQRAV